MFYFSSQSFIGIGGQRGGGGGENLNYFLHSIEYLFLSLLVARGFHNSRFKKISSFLTLIVSVLYGISDEVHQYFVPGRMFSLIDILTDLMGIIIGVILYRRIKKF